MPRPPSHERTGSIGSNLQSTQARLKPEAPARPAPRLSIYSKQPRVETQPHHTHIAHNLFLRSLNKRILWLAGRRAAAGRAQGAAPMPRGRQQGAGRRFLPSCPRGSWGANKARQGSVQAVSTRDAATWGACLQATPHLGAGRRQHPAQGLEPTPPWVNTVNAEPPAEAAG